MDLISFGPATLAGPPLVGTPEKTPSRPDCKPDFHKSSPARQNSARARVRQQNHVGQLFPENFLPNERVYSSENLLLAVPWPQGKKLCENEFGEIFACLLGDPSLFLPGDGAGEEEGHRDAGGAAVGLRRVTIPVPPSPSERQGRAVLHD